MNLPTPLADRLNSYLSEVRAALGDRPPSLRDAIVADLERQALDALEQRAAGREPTAEDLEAVLGGMDPAAAFAAPAAEGVSTRRSSRWFWLALAFLVVNAWGVWRWTSGTRAPVGAVWVREFAPGNGARIEGAVPLRWRFSAPMVGAAEIGPAAEPPAHLLPPVAGRFVWKDERELVFTPDEPWPLCQSFEVRLDDALTDRRGRPVSGERAFAVRTAPLQLVRVEQAGLGGDGVQLRLTFNAPPLRSSLARALTFRLPGQNEALTYRFVGDAVAREVLVAVNAPPTEELEVALEAGVLPHKGALGLEKSVSQRVNITTRLALTRLETDTPSFGPPSLRAFFTAAVDLSTAAEAISIEPKLPFRIAPLETWRGSGLTIEADFAAGGVYTFRFGAGLRSLPGAELGVDVVRAVNFPDRPPALSFSADGSYLSPAGPMPVALTAVNIADCEVTLARILPENLVFFAMRQAGRYDRSYSYGLEAAAEKLSAPVATRTLAVGRRPNEIATLRLDLRDWLGDGAGGAYELTARHPKAGETRKLVVVTDLGLSIKSERDGLLVWAVSLREGRPVGGARVTVFAENNRLLAEAETDADGLARLACRTDDPDAPPFLVLARRGADISYALLEGGVPIAPEKLAAERPYVADGHEACVFTDRGIYRPGETLRVKAVVRNRAQEAPDPFPVELCVYRPDGRVHRRWTALLSEVGTAEWSEPWPDYLPLGRYRLALAVPGAENAMGETQVLLEEYAPPQIAVELRADDRRFPTGTPLEFSVSARHLFGRPASGLLARAAATVEATPFAPDGWSDWRFGDSEKQFPRLHRELGQATLDDAGVAQWRLGLAPEWRPPAALRVTLSATVIETSGRAVTSWAARVVDSYPFYIGLRSPNLGGAVEAGAEQTISVAAVSPNGEVFAAAERLEAELFRIEHTTLLRRRDDGRLAYETVRLLSSVAKMPVTLTAGRGETRCTPDRAGDYLLVVRDPASCSSSSLPFYAADRGESWVGWAMERPDRVEIQLDRPRYLPGDRVQATIKAPFAGLALVTVETDRVLARRLIPMSGNTAAVELPVTEAWRPNAWLTVSVVRPVTPAKVWTPHRAVGLAAVAVDAPERRLSLDVEAPKQIRPQSRLEAVVRVRDSAGAPAANAEVVVAAVDEGICNLTDFRTPDPAAWFQALRKPGVNLFDLYGDLVPLLDERLSGAASHPPGGEGAALARRLNPIRARRFRPTALWSGTVHTDEAGIARVNFDVPEFTGELRVMAVAVNRQATGSTARAVTVKRPLVVETALPRFLAPGDQCLMSLAIFNETGADQTVRVTVQSDGPLTVRDYPRTLRLAAGAQTTVRAPLTAGARPGLAQCRIEVEAGEERYAEAIELPIRPAAPPVTVLRDGVVSAGGSAEIRAPDDWLAETVEAEIWCGADPEIALGGALDQLLRYPYGCLEQTVSSAFPLLYLADLAQRVRPAALGAMETEHFARAALWRVLGMQQTHGGFALWPNGETQEWASIYAAHFLVEATRAGLDVPAERRDAALDFLRELLRRPTPADADSPAWRYDRARRAYACHVLALAGKPDHGWNARLLETADRLNASARCNLALALILSGRPREAGALLNSAAKAPESGRQLGGNLDSPARDLALELAARLETDPSDPRVAQLAMRLSGLRVNGAWLTTQESAMALMALGKYYRARPRPAAAFEAELEVGGRRFALDHTGIFRWNGELDGRAPLRWRNRGPGPLLYFARLHGVPASGRVEEGDHGLRVRRQLLDWNGNPLDGGAWPTGEAAVVRIVLDTMEQNFDNIVIEDLLPAGLEIENPALATSQITPWIGESAQWVQQRDLRDDRLILFTGPVYGRREFHYTVRAVTPGRYVWPAIQASAMYDPSVRSAHGGGSLDVTSDDAASPW